MPPTANPATGGTGDAAQEFRHDAFLSYAHEDQETVDWLDERLSRFWVPGKRRRDVYLDRRHVTARTLDEQIENALRETRYFVLCWSASAARSSWVLKEIERFLELFPDALADGRVLLCRVGRSDDETPLPRVLASHAALMRRPASTDPISDSETPGDRGEAGPRRCARSSPPSSATNRETRSSRAVRGD
jgi:hypothetical protein